MNETKPKYRTMAELDKMDEEAKEKAKDKFNAIREKSARYEESRVNALCKKFHLDEDEARALLDEFDEYEEDEFEEACGKIILNMRNRMRERDKRSRRLEVIEAHFWLFVFVGVLSLVMYVVTAVLPYIFDAGWSLLWSLVMYIWEVLRP